MPSKKQNIPPEISPSQAIPLLKRQLSRLDDIRELRHRDAQIEAWESTTDSVLTKAFGMPNGELHKNTSDIRYMQSAFPVYVGMPDHERQRNHESIQVRRAVLLKAIIEQLQDKLGPSPTLESSQAYQLHPEIERVSGQMYRDRHFKSAALEAYICVIEAVKAKSGLRLDGDSLMNHAFGIEGGRTPTIQVNSLATDAERDEQKGFMFLFKGIVSLRNSKAHSNALFDDPSRGLEYLNLASLLIRVLEISTTNEAQ